MSTVAQQKVKSGSSEVVSTTTVKTTKVSAGGAEFLEQKRYNPVAAARTVVIQRTAANAMGGGGGGGGRSSEISRSFSGGSYANAPPGAHTNVAHSGVTNIRSGREKEKKDMQELNERFANYIEKVRFLEAQNKKLANELQNLKDKWGKETDKIKQMYETELQQLRKLLDEGEKYKAELEVRVTSMEDHVNEQQINMDELQRQHNVDRETIDKLNHQLADFEGELSLLRRRVGSFDEERSRDKKEIQRLRDEVSRLRADLDQETLNHINSENEAQSLKEELEFIKQIHEAEMKELAALAYRDTTAENREYWKNELAQALHDIQSEYDDKMDIMKNDQENFYKLKVQEFRTTTTKDNMELTHVREENKRIKSQLQDIRNRVPELEARNAGLEREIQELRREMEEERRENDLMKTRMQKDMADQQAELESVLHELQVLLDAKLSLELEIAAYRKLLECEEVRITKHHSSSEFALHGESETTSVDTTASRQQMSSIIKGEMSAKTTFQKTSKGSVQIQECAADGKYIVLENAGKKREEIGGWKISRNIDNGRQTVKFGLPKECALEGEGERKCLKIWAKGQRPGNAPAHDLEFHDKSWGMGANIVTSLNNADGEEKATHSQKTVYATS